MHCPWDKLLMWLDVIFYQHFSAQRKQIDIANKRKKPLQIEMIWVVKMLCINSKYILGNFTSISSLPLPLKFTLLLFWQDISLAPPGHLLGKSTVLKPCYAPYPQPQCGHGCKGLVHYKLMYISPKWASAWDFQQCGMCDQQSLTRNLIRAFASRLSIVWLLSY